MTTTASGRKEDGPEARRLFAAGTLVVWNVDVFERSWSEPIGLMCRTVRKFIA